MSHRFFRTLNDRERDGINDRAQTLAQMLLQWAAGYSVTRHRRVPSVALLTAACVPRIPPHDALPTMKLSFWEFGIDDIADERQVSQSELESLARHFGSLAGGHPPTPQANRDELSAMLHEVRGDLARYPLFASLGEAWAQEVERFVMAMAFEYRYGSSFRKAGPETLPSLEEYLSWTLYSIGIPLWALAIWIAADDASILKCLEPVWEATRHASIAVRLLNDLRTYRKEIEEQSVNAVLIAGHADATGNAGPIPGEQALAGAVERLKQLVDTHCQLCLDAAGRVRTDSGMVEETLARTALFHADFYGGGEDYNTTSLSQVGQLLTS